MQKPLEYQLVNNYKCKRCGCTSYDKKIYTGMKTLDEIDSIIYEQYVCRNCDFPFDITEYLKNHIESISMLPSELLQQSQFVDEGTEILNNGKIIYKGDKHNE